MTMTKTLLTLSAALTAAAAAAAPPKQLFAHYMGCFPLDKFGDPYPAKLKYDSGEYDHAIGGAFYNPPLVPRDYRADPVEAAALDIRRAIRAGVDGFAIDVFAGRERAIETMRHLFQAAEKYDLPFQITLCLDAPYRNPAAIKLILDEFGNSPKLARRNGKVLFFGYNTRDAENYVREYFERKAAGKQIVPANFAADTNFKGLPQLERDTLDFPELKKLDDLWCTPEGFAAQIKPFRHYEQLYGQGKNLAFQFELSSYLRGFSGARNYAQMEMLRRAVAGLAREFDSLGSFLPSTFCTPEEIVELAAIARENGAEWGEALCYQYDNPKWTRVHQGRTVENLIRRWEMIERTGATLLQFTTWNDYAENTILAPAHETRYVLGELNACFAEKWKTGRFPKPESDKIYAIYHKYPVGAERDCFPFQAARVIDLDKKLEVVTMLTEPGVVTLAGRDIRYEAPAGFCYRQFPLTPGPVEIKVERGGQTVKELKCSEPIVADHVFRPQSTPTMYSTEFMKFWREDFGDAEPVSLEGYYAVRPGSKFPNWFRMVYFGRYGDFRNLPEVDPEADPDGDGVNNYQEYCQGTDPTRPDRAYESGYVWAPATDLPRNLSFNPDRDRERHPVWRYGATRVDGQPFTLFPDLERRPGAEGWVISHQFPWYSRELYPWGREPRDYSLPQCSLTQEWNAAGQQLVLRPNTQYGAAVEFRIPADGDYRISFQAEAGHGGRCEVRLEDPVNGRMLSGQNFPADGTVEKSLRFTARAGDRLYLVGVENPAGQSVKIRKLEVTRL